MWLTLILAGAGVISAVWLIAVPRRLRKPLPIFMEAALVMVALWSAVEIMVRVARLF
jgi:hypothetical protein